MLASSTTPAGPAGGPPPRGPAGARKEDWIADQLRMVYDQALREEIPPEMLTLLSQIDDPVSDEEPTDDAAGSRK